MKQAKFLKIIVILYAITVIFWLALIVVSKYALVGESTLSFLKLLTQIPLMVIPLVGGILGFRNSIAWGGLKSIIGRSILFLSLGLFTWGCGMIVWNYYIFFTGIEIPYPSFADVGYVLGLIFLIFGVWQLSKVVGVNFALRTKKGKVLLLLIPLVVISISVYLLVYVARGGVLVDTSTGYLKLFFDLLYPLGDVVNLTITVSIYLLSIKLLGGKYKIPILMLLAGFVMFYISDFSFSYTTTLETYSNGSFVDFLFTTTMFILSLGVVGFSSPDNGKKLGIPNLANAKEVTIFNEILIKIIKRQELIMGQIAWDEAENIGGFTVDNSHNAVSFYGDQKEIIDHLVLRYEELFGKASREVCKDAVRRLTAGMPAEEIPSSLK